MATALFVKTAWAITLNAALLAVIHGDGVEGRTFTVFNACNFTIWPAIFTPRVSKALPNYYTGWQADPLTEVQFFVPDTWVSGRIWGRRACDFASNNGTPSCLSAGCNGGMECDVDAGTGATPATLAEWTLAKAPGQDFFDVSVVDGFNLPMKITNDQGCPEASCTADLAAMCPPELRGPIGPNNETLGCNTGCAIEPDHDDSATCCTGSHSTPDKCPSSGVRYYDFFKGNCPNAYAYAYDESSGTALHTCDAAKQANYVLTFCPNDTANALTPSATATSIASGTTGLAPTRHSGARRDLVPDAHGALARLAVAGALVLVGAFTTS